MEQKPKRTRTKKVATEVAVIPQELPSIQERENNSIEGFISKAIAQNVPVETMERLLAMRKDLKAEHAKEAFTAAMAKFQAECPVIVKTKEVKTRSGQVAYRYAPIESIVIQVKDALNANGFSYSTNMKLLEAGVSITVKVTHILGHSEDTEMTVPFGSKTDIMSQSQVAAAASTFAKRYAFLNAFGILTGDEDTDAAPQPPVAPPVAAKPLDATNPVFAVYRKRLEESKTLEELGMSWADIPPQAKKALEALKDELKAMITSELKTIT